MSVDTVLNRPMSTGSVYLRDSDPHSQPKIDGRWLSHPDDVDTQVCGLKKIREIVRVGPLNDVIAEVTSPANFLSASDESLSHYVRQNQQSTWHYSCTARMGGAAGPSSGYVCSPKGLVYGVEGLRVCDASLMPRVVGGNTQATAYVLGDRVGLFAAESFATVSTTLGLKSSL